MTDRQIPQTNYLPPHLVPVKWVTAREFCEEYPPRTPDEVLSQWKLIAEQERDQ